MSFSGYISFKSGLNKLSAQVDKLKKLFFLLIFIPFLKKISKRPINILILFHNVVCNVLRPSQWLNKCKSNLYSHLREPFNEMPWIVSLDNLYDNLNCYLVFMRVVSFDRSYQRGVIIRIIQEWLEFKNFKFFSLALHCNN